MPHATLDFFFITYRLFIATRWVTSPNLHNWGAGMQENKRSHTFSFALPLKGDRPGQKKNTMCNE